jgi:ParB family chromosome partitioning protein
MDKAMLGRLKASVTRYGVVQNLIVRPIGSDAYEVISGNQRLRVLREAEVKTAPCVVVHLDDAHARLLAQALNHIQGEDDLGLRAELLRQLLETMPQEDVLALLPENPRGLRALASLGQTDLAGHLQAWESARAARLRHLVFQLTEEQMGTVKEALARVMPQAKREHGASPNVRGTALYLVCNGYLQREASK